MSASRSIPQPRLMVIGEKIAQANHSVAWNDKNWPNVVDFDVVILNMQTLVMRAPELKLDSLNELRQKLVRVIGSGGQVVALCDDPNRQIRLLASGGKQVSVRMAHFLPIGVLPVSESGSTINAQTSSFASYLQQVNNWSFHFSFGSVAGVAGNSAFGAAKSYLVNREGRMLAGEFRWQNGRFILLPPGNFHSYEHAISLVLEGLGINLRSIEPSWASAVVVPGLDQISGEINAANEEIAALTAEISLLQDKFKQLAEYRKLLFSEGGELEEVVRKSLVFLGAAINPRKYGTEEYLLSYKGLEHLIEVKGVSTSAALKHVRQLIDNQLIAEETNGMAPHCILIANAWRQERPELRGTEGKVEFPENVIARASANQIALLSTRQLFAAVCEKLSGRADGQTFLERITSTVGVV